MYQQTQNHSLDTEKDKTNTIKTKENISRNSTVFPRSVCKMSEEIYILKQLSTHEYFTKFRPCENFKTTAKLHYQVFVCVSG